MGAQSMRVQSLSRAWVAMGHEVTVLTAFPNHPAGKLYPGWRRRFMKLVDVSDDKGVRVVRVAHVPRANRGAANRLVSFSSFTISAALAALAMPRFDVVIGTVPQPLQPLAAWSASRIRRSKFILEIRDLWPEGLVATGQAGRGSIAYAGLNRVASHLYGSADHVVAVTDAIRDHIVDDWDVPAERVDVVRAAVDASAFEPVGDVVKHKQRWSQDGKFTVSYVGTLGNAHDLAMVLDAAALLQDTRPDIEFLFTGDGAEGPELRIKARGMKNVRFLGARPRGDLSSIFAASDVCLAVLRPDPLFTTVVPTKLYEYMAAGKPIINNVPGEAAALIEAAATGSTIAPGDPKGLATAVLRLADNPELRETMARNGPGWVRSHADWNNRTEQYASILERVSRR
jgi:colanic acid biosynthesis glycosyl transferase WcaI